MLTTRIIAVINILNGITVQSINFTKYLPVGLPEIAVDYLNKWGIDEIVILNIKGSLNSDYKLYKHLSKYSRKCHVPIAAGGGIKNLNDIENLIRNGADKVVINSEVHINPGIIEKGAKEFGEQAIVVSIDVKKIKNDYIVFTESGSNIINLPFVEVLRNCEDYGAGEILINSIDMDGSKKGYDLELFNFVKDVVSIPIVGCGGVGRSEHFLKGHQLGLSGLAAGNYFHYTEHSVILLKSYLCQNIHDIRLDTYADYHLRKFEIDERLVPLSDNKLERLRFEYIPEEKI